MGKHRGIDALRLHAIHNLLKPFLCMIGQKEVWHGIEGVEDIIFQKDILAAALIREETLIELYHKAFLRMQLVEEMNLIWRKEEDGIIRHGIFLEVHRVYATAIPKP